MIDFLALEKSHEKKDLEVKLAEGGVPKSLYESYSAFANTFGGTIILGIDEEKGTGRFILKGINHPEGKIQDIWNTLNNRTKVSSNIMTDARIYKQSYQNMEFIVMEVPEADRQQKPIYLNDDLFEGSFRRDNEGDYHCRKEEVLAMLRDQNAESADSAPAENIGISELNEETIKAYRNLFAAKHPTHIWNQLGKDDFLMKIGAIKRGRDSVFHPTIAGLIMFGDFVSIISALPNYFLDYREHIGNDERWSDRISCSDGDWSGNVFDFYFRVQSKITLGFRTPFQLDEDALRVDETPEKEAARELLANALIHADYYGRQGVVIDRYEDHIVYANPGLFRIRVEDAVSGGKSDARNATLFNMFALIKVGERAGMGLCDAFASLKKAGSSSQTVDQKLSPDRTIVMVTMPNDGKGSGVTSNDTNHDANDTNHDTNDTNQKKSEIDSRILTLLAKDGTLSASSLSKKLGVSVPTIKRAFIDMQKKKLIERIGSTRGYWKVNNK